MRLGWLSPRGDFIRCEKYEHYDIAQDLCKRRGADLSREEADEKLLSAGWVRITLSSLPPIQYFICYRRLSEEQKNWLKNEIDDLPANDYPIDKFTMSKINDF